MKKRESSLHFSQRDLSRIRVTKKRDLSRVIDSSHAITAKKYKNVPEVTFSPPITGNRTFYGSVINFQPKKICLNYNIENT